MSNGYIDAGSCGGPGATAYVIAPNHAAVPSLQFPPWPPHSPFLQLLFVIPDTVEVISIEADTEVPIHHFLTFFCRIPLF